MSLIDRFRDALRGLRDSTEDRPPVAPPADEPSDGHAPGHRHMGPPPEQAPPSTSDPEKASNQPWIRRSHSDSQTRRFRR